MDEKTLQALQALAQKRGTTAEYLWGVLVKQAQISTTVDCVEVFIVLIVLALVWRKAIRIADGIDKEAVFFGFAILGVVTVFVVFFVAFRANLIAAGFMNPEYWALHELLRSVK